MSSPAGVTYYSYDDFGNVATTTQPSGAVTATLYDGFGELVQVTDTDGNVTQYAYDGMGKKVLNRTFTAANATGTALNWTYAYDAFGDEVQSIDGDGHEIDSTYDSLGRKLGDTWVGSTYSSTYSYDALSEPIAAADNASQYSFSYNDQRYLQSQTIAYAGLSNTFTMADGYNLQGQRTSLTASSGAAPGTPIFSNAYTLDGLGRPPRSTRAATG